MLTQSEVDVIVKRNATNFSNRNKLNAYVGNITVKGHKGTWYIIGDKVVGHKLYLLLESEQHGEDAPALIVDKDYNLILEEVENGFEDLEEHFDRLKFNRMMKLGGKM